MNDKLMFAFSLVALLCVTGLVAMGKVDKDVLLALLAVSPLHTVLQKKQPTVTNVDTAVVTVESPK